MQIRSLALLFMSSLGALSAASAVVAWSGHWAAVDNVTKAQRLVEVMQPAIAFVEALALERGVYNQVLVSKETGAGGSLQLVSAQAQKTDRLFDAALDRLAALPAPLAFRLRAHFVKAQDIVRTARSEADPVWMSPTRTSAGAAARLVQSYVAAKGEIDEALAISSRDLASRDAGVGLMLEVSMLSNELRELAGRRSTILSRYAGTHEKFTVAERVAVSQDTGSIRTTWERLQRLARQIDAPVIHDAVAKVQRDFFDSGEPLYIAMADAARDGLPPPVSFLEWRKWTVDTLTLTLAARDAPIAHAMAQLEAMRTDAIWQFYVSLAGFGGAILIIAVAGVMVEVRIVRPLSQLTKGIDELVASPKEQRSTRAADSARRYVDLDRRDEIGSLGRALARLSQYARELLVLNERFDTVLANLPQGVCFYEQDDTLVIANEAYASIYGLSAAQCAAGATLTDVLRRRSEAGDPALGLDGDEAVAAAAREGAATQRADISLRSGRTICVVGVRMPRGGWLATHTDTTETTRATQQIAHMASHDALTNLPNRTFFHAELERLVARPSPASEVAVMCLDLDRFKAVNDTLGHGCGDELLKQVASRLTRCVRSGDLVARFGGDEFAVIIADPGPHLADIGRRIVEAISAPFQLTDHQALVGVSVGVAISRAEHARGPELLRSADLALYRAKADGRGVVRFFDPTMDEDLQSRRLLELDLRSALSRDEFELFYQPMLDLDRNEISGFEALLRWNHPRRGRVAAGDFIPLAEETGLIGKIGEWVLRRACADAAAWPKPVKVAINLSPAQFVAKELSLDVAAALLASGLPPQRLEVEITERVMLTNTDAAVETLNRIRGLGVSVALDDFGAGYSSLAYLRLFRFDKIKIDQSFVRDIDHDPNLVSIVRAVAGLAASLSMATTAEGVETRQQLDAVKAEGCTEVQGYYLSGPVPCAEVAALLLTSGATAAA